MKRMLSVFLLIFLTFMVYSNNSHKEEFNTALLYYTKSDFNKALDVFLDLSKKGYDNFEINYNIGSCYFKSGKLGLARYYYEKALFYKPFDKELFYNLKVVYLKLLSDPAIGEQEVMNKRIIFFLQKDILFILIVVFFIISFILLFIFLKFFDKKILLVSFIIFAFFTSVFTFFFILQYMDYNKKVFVVKNETANVYLIPKEKESPISSIKEGTKGIIVEEATDFAKININDGLSGWVNKKDLIRN
jgi:tetratricopeptide (TPR) repeat protein